MTEMAAERLSPSRAAELTRLLDLKCRWENMRLGASISTAQLHALQKAFDAYRNSLMAYSGGNRNEPIPDLSPSGPNRLRTWCRTLRVILSRSASMEYPANIIEKARIFANKIANRVHTESAPRGISEDMDGAIHELDMLIAWCSSLEVSQRQQPEPALATAPAFEIGLSGI